MKNRPTHFILGVAAASALVYGTLQLSRELVQVKLPNPVLEEPLITNPLPHPSPMATTEAYIKSVKDQESGSLYITTRNPFLWEGELTPIQPPERIPQPPRLGMTVIGPGVRFALLDGKPVREGGKHGVFKVSRVKPGEVSLLITTPTGVKEVK